MRNISGDMKGFLIFLSILFAIILLICFPKWGCGIFFPKYTYIFELSEYEKFSSKNFKNHLVFKNELNMTLSSSGMFSNDRNIWSSIFTDKPYNMLHIKQFNCYYQGREIELFSDFDVELPEQIKMVNSLSDYFSRLGIWATDGVGRYLAGVYSSQMPVIKLGKILKHKKIGEEFPFQLKIKYSFDNGEERNCELHYNVKVIKRDLPTFFLFFIQFL